MNLLLAAATLLFVVGVLAPMLTLKKLIVVRNTFSVVSGIAQLAVDGHYGLFVIILAFSVILPCWKLWVLFRACNSSPVDDSGRRHLRWMNALGKWSMLDVFVVAVLIASVKLGALASIELHAGLYAFAAAVILMMMATHLLHEREAGK